MKKIIGVIGEAGSGKSEITKIFESLGCPRLSLSDVLREIATKIGLSHSRENLINLGNALREQFGPAVLAMGLRDRIEEINADFVIVESIRNPEELRFLRQNFDSTMIGISMNEEKKFELMRARDREGDPKTWDEYMTFRSAELGKDNGSAGIKIEECLELCDIRMNNDGTLVELRESILEINREIISRKKE
jgi:dephospho-CoA kinase